MTKRILAMTLTVFLLLANAALAAPGDVALYMDFTDGFNQTTWLYSITVVGDTAYATIDDNLTRGERYKLAALKLGETEPQLYAFEDQEEVGTQLYNVKLIAWGDRLMLLNTDSGKLYEVALADGQATINEVLLLDMVEKQNLADEDMYWGVSYVVAPWVGGNTLYTYGEEPEGSGYLLAAYDLTDGTGRAIPNDLDTRWLTPGREGELLYAMADAEDWTAPATLYTFSMEDGSSQAVCKLMNSSPYGLTYDAAHDRVIYLNDGLIYATAMDGTSEELGTIPVTNLYNGTSQYVPESNFLVVGDEQTGLIVRNLDSQYKATRQLTIRCTYLDVDETYMAFTAGHSDVEVKALTSAGGITADEVTQAMMSGSSEADIYVLNVDSSAFNAMVNRGYVVDLSGSDILTEAVSRMYPQFADVFTKDGKVIAFPKEESDTSYLFNVELAEKMGITPPKTWDEFLDLVERWDSDFSQDYPEKAIFTPLNDAEMKGTLMNMLLQDYETLLNRPGQEQAFNTPTLRHLLEHLDQIDYAPFNSEKDFSNGYSWGGEDVLIDQWGNFLPSVQGPNSMGGEGDTFLISMDDETDPAVPINMTVYVVNPYSKNQDMAIEYLEACAQTMPEYRQMLYFTDWTDPIENPNFEKRLADYDATIAELEEMLADAEADQKQHYEDSIAIFTGLREKIIKEEKYIYSEEQVKAYQDSAKYAVVMRHRYISGGDESGTDEMASIVQRYVDGQLEAGQMLKELDQKLRMMQMENDG